MINEYLMMISENVLLAVMSVILASATVFLVILVVTQSRYSRLKEFIDSGIDNLSREYVQRRLKAQVKKYSSGIQFKMGFVEKLELKYIDKSNIRKYVPFFNIYVLFLISVSVFFTAYRYVYGTIHSHLASIILCSLFAWFPFLALDIWGRINSDRVRKKLAAFISVINRWCSVKADIIYAFEKAVDSGIQEPLRTYIRDMAIQVRKGLDVDEALDILQMKVDSSQFRDLILNIREALRHRGDLRKLFTNIESEFYKLEEEYNRRKISTYKDRLIVYCSMADI